MKVARCFLVSALTLASPLTAHASPITLHFAGTVDLSAFGGPADSVFDGSIAWNATFVPQQGDGSGWSRFLIDGAPESVTATLAVNGTDYSSRIQPISRLEFDASSMFLELWFQPVIDLDAGPAPDTARVALDAWTDDVTAVFFDFDAPPPDLAFLSRLEHRRLLFLSAMEPPDFELTSAEASRLVVPEPALFPLIAFGIALVSDWRRLGPQLRN